MAIPTNGTQTSVNKLKLGIFQTAGVFGDPLATLELLDDAAKRAANEKVDILVMPELFLTGYNLGKTKVLEMAGYVADGPLNRVHDIARAHNIALVFGYPELVGNKVANAALFIGADGKTLLNYQKVHLYGDLDRQMFEIRGETFPVVSYRGWCIGLAICYDIEFPETGRLLALQGADCILVPTALMPPYIAVPQAVVPARGYEEQLYIAYANHCGAETDVSYIGKSCICGPDGTVLASAGDGPDFITAEIDKDRITSARAGESLLGDRRPELYRNLSR
jgi:5-aminopentanamidase